MAIATAFTKKFGLKIPIVGAPMAGVSGPALAAAVSSAGGLGFLGAAFYKEASQLRKYVDLSWSRDKCYSYIHAMYQSLHVVTI
jgi:nitronate monooxygenase